MEPTHTNSVATTDAATGLKTAVEGEGNSERAAVPPARRRWGKQPMTDDRTEEERKPIVVNMAKARGISRARLIAVGVFLSLFPIPSKQLVNYMRKVWKIRGSLDSHQLTDRRFALEFSEEGDYEHVTKGGPWRYQGDAVLIRAIKEEDDPETIPFKTVPIWAQFAGIPFYLLSKELVRELGGKLGQLISIDNNARGDICDKILRARVLLPIARPLQRWITLEDEITDEEVVVSVLYERLPSFCLCCGVIGHLEASCDLPASMRRRTYNTDIGVAPTHIDDPRCWYLPATTGQHGCALQMALPWRIPAHGVRYAPAATPQFALVTRVANEVEKLTVNDNLHGDTPAHASANEKTAPPTPSVASIPSTLEPAGETEAATIKAGQTSDPLLLTHEVTTAAAVLVVPIKKYKRTGKEAEAVSKDAKTQAVNSGSRLPGTPLPKTGRHELKLTAANTAAHALTSRGAVLGKRTGTGDDDSETEDAAGDAKNSNKKTRREAKTVQHEDMKRNDGGLEATSPGAAGKLTGATDSTCQEK